jgi:hypothetical protein
MLDGRLRGPLLGRPARRQGTLALLISSAGGAVIAAHQAATIVRT